MRHLSRILACVCAVLCMAGCPQQKTSAPATATPQPAASVQPGAPASAPSNGPPRQLILIYTGETLSAPLANTSYKPATGGLSALAQTITQYESEILRFNQARVQNAGGDPAAVRADFKAGMLGDNPFMLLDYGLWERPNDPAGELYVALYYEFFTRFNYTAVGSMLYERLDAARWDKYRACAPPEFKLLISAGQAQGQPLPSVPVATRELYGARWGIAAIPQPRLNPDGAAPTQAEMLERMRAFVDTAAAKLQAAGCENTILLAGGGPPQLYKELSEDKRFTVVIGATHGTAITTGFGKAPAAGPVLLPALAGGGREAAFCHLYFTPTGTRPSDYFFTKRSCEDRGQSELPLRKQVAAAVAQHQQLRGGSAN